MKYILECEKIEKTINPETKRLYLAEGKNYLISSTIASHITPYDEESAYQKGRYTAQEVYRRLAMINNKKRKEIFNYTLAENIIVNFTVDEIERKIDEYENGIRVGDEIINYDNDVIGVVAKVDTFWLDVVDKYGAVHDVQTVGCKKTGRHFDEVAQLLEKLNDGK